MMARGDFAWFLEIKDYACPGTSAMKWIGHASFT